MLSILQEFWVWLTEASQGAVVALLENLLSLLPAIPGVDMSSLTTWANVVNAWVPLDLMLNLLVLYLAWLVALIVWGWVRSFLRSVIG